jgi:hypothetical protein
MRSRCLSICCRMATSAFTVLSFAHAGASLAALGGFPAQFGPNEPTIVSSASSGASAYIKRDTTLATGTHVREYVTGGNIVFGVTWDGPVLPDLKALLGKQHFDAMVAEAKKQPKAGRGRLQVKRPDFVVDSGGHMRAFEGSAWMPSEFPVGFVPADAR